MNTWLVMPLSLRAFTIPSDENLLNSEKIQDRSHIIESGIFVYDRWICPIGVTPKSENIMVHGDVDLHKKFGHSNFIAKELTVFPDGDGELVLSVDNAKHSDDAVIVLIEAVANGNCSRGISAPNPKENYRVSKNVCVLAELMGTGYVGNSYFNVTWLNMLVLMTPKSEVKYYSLDGKAIGISPNSEYSGPEKETSVICPTLLTFEGEGGLTLTKGPYKGDDIFRSSKERFRNIPFKP